MIALLANGKEVAVEGGTSVEGFIRARGLDPALVIVERNGEPLHRRSYASVELEPGDRLELVRAVAGG